MRQISGDQAGLDGLEDTINGVVQNKGGAGALLGIGLVTALWSASGYIGAFMRASNAIYEIPEGRQFWKLRPLQVIVTLTMVMLVALLAVSLVTTGPVAEAIGDQIGLGDEFVTIYGIAKWPLMALIVLCMLAVLYYSAPNAKLPKFRWITPGAVLALTIWIVASAGFGFYVANFGSYNKTYGTLGGAISLLVWLWITNIAVLLGQELNAEVERGRELSAGLPADEGDPAPAAHAAQGGSRGGERADLARGALHARARGDDGGPLSQSATCRAFGSDETTSAPSSVTITRSSIRTPTAPGT